jgi:hypothetical protein
MLLLLLLWMALALPRRAFIGTHVLLLLLLLQGLL